MEEGKSAVKEALERYYKAQEPPKPRKRKKSTNPDVPLERVEHSKFARTLRKLGLFWIHVPNEGKRSAIQGARLKNLGMLKGVADFIIFDPTPRGGYIGVVIEMKRLKHSSTSEEQIEFLRKMAARGYLAVVTKGHAAAEEVLRRVGFLEGVPDASVEQNNRIRQIEQVCKSSRDDPGEARFDFGGHTGDNLPVDERELDAPTGDGSENPRPDETGPSEGLV